MRQTFYLKLNDTSPSLLYYVLPKSTDLTGATVRFSMKRAGDGAIKINKQTAVVVTPTGAPAIRYDWQSNDVNAADHYEAEFHVTYLNGRQETFPNNEFIDVIIGQRAA